MTQKLTVLLFAFFTLMTMTFAQQTIKGKSPYKRVSIKKASQIAKPIIAWQSPSRNNYTTTNKRQTIEACITSKEKPDVVLYVNGTRQNSRDFNIVPSNNCYKWKMILDFGNTGSQWLELRATNTAGTTSSSRVITIQQETQPEPVVINTTQKRLALVIGNAKYHDYNAQLKNPANDANDMASRLEQLGFKVIKKVNATQREMKTAIRDYTQQLKNYDMGLVHYSGHGLQVNGENYLIPVDATNIESEADIEYETVSVSWMLAKMENANSNTNIVVLDACRNNPFRRWIKGSGDKGLTIVKAQPQGSLIAFATSPGNVAQDGTGRNGTYTEAMLKFLQKGVDIYTLLTKINGEVTKNTAGKQSPWFNSSLSGMFRF